MFPTLFHVGPFTIYSYGLSVAVALLASFFLLKKSARNEGVSEGDVMDLLFFLFLAGIVGGRIFYVLQHIEDYEGNFWRAMKLQEGGLIWYGGFITASLAAMLYVSFRHLPALKYFDVFAPALPLGHAIGRMGCFLNGCCYGKETTSFLGVHFPGDDFLRHPTQLYEAGLLLLLSFLLYRFSLRRHREGEVFVGYLLFYPIIRFFIEFLRGDQSKAFYWTLPQWTSVLLFTGALFLLIFLRKKKVSR